MWTGDNLAFNRALTIGIEGITWVVLLYLSDKVVEKLIRFDCLLRTNCIGIDSGLFLTAMLWIGCSLYIFRYSRPGLTSHRSLQHRVKRGCKLTCLICAVAFVLVPTMSYALSGKLFASNLSDDPRYELAFYATIFVCIIIWRQIGKSAQNPSSETPLSSASCTVMGGPNVRTTKRENKGNIGGCVES